MDKLIIKGIVTDLDRSKNDVTYLPPGRSLIVGEHWDNLKGALSLKEDPEAIQNEKVQIALKVTASAVIEKGK